MPKKIAILSDIHGNASALNAVLEDASRQEVTDYWLLGDTFLPGPGVQEILDLLAPLPLTAHVRGNWEDRFLGSLSGEIDLTNPTDIYLARLSQYLNAWIPKESIHDIKATPLHQIQTLEGLTFSISHHLPHKNYGRDLITSADTVHFDQLFESPGSDIAIYGHIHAQVMRYSNQGQLIINPGAVGQPYFPWVTFRQDLRAQYTILDLDKQGVANVDFRRVAFDIDQELDLAKKRDLPYRDLYQDLLTKGISHTHNKALLAQMNQELGYYREVINYFGLK